MTVHADPMRARGSDVALLADIIARGDFALSNVAESLKAIIHDESWRAFITKLGKEVHHERFADFVATPPLAGLGTTPEMLARIVAEDPTAAAALRKALKGSRNNITTTGTRRDYTIDRLERDSPDLHAEVLAGHLTAHAAAVRAGFRPPTFTVRGDSPESIAACLRRRLEPDVLAQLAKLLAAGA